MDEKTVSILQAAIQKLNPGSRIIRSSFGKIDTAAIFNTGLFDFEEAQYSAGWQKEPESDYHHPETEEYGISSFVFRSRKPFHPERFWHYLNQQYPAGILRAKGLFWLASRPNDALNFSQAGGSSRLENAGVWWCSMPYADRLHYTSFVHNKELIEQRWSRQWGDRMNELVFIGQGIKKEEMIADLEKCLLQDSEQFLFDKHILFKDPFPKNI